MNKKLRIKIDEKIYEVEVEYLSVPSTVNLPKGKDRPTRTKLKKSTLSPVSSSASSGGQALQEGDVPSPLSGRVVTVHVSPEQEVKEGDNLITLEAMKMNTYVVSPKNGKVKEVLVEPGGAINEGQVLIKLI